MKLISAAHMLIKSGNYWVGFNEYGKYIATQPYIGDVKARGKVIADAIFKGNKLGAKLHGPKA
jgi:hypothetical protein